jgi:nitrous oxidase accessory protein NosD
MTDRSNAHAGGQLDTGCTRFVDATANPNDLVGTPACGELSNVPKDGSSLHPYLTVNDGLQVADPGDVVLVRPGSYDVPVVISQRVTLRATRGVAILRPSGP